MALILKQESNAAVTTPSVGSGSIFLNGSDQLTVKDSTGNISTIPTFTATGNAQIFYNNAGALGLSPNLTFNNTTNTLGVTTANVNTLNFGSGSVTGTGNITTGNLIGTIAAGSNTITTTGNITGGNIIGPVVAGSNTITTTGNANVGNLGFGAGVITGTGNITAGNIIGTIAAGSNTISTTGNANVGNIGAATAIFTTGNITTVNSGLVQNGTSNVTIAASGNVSTFINGNTTPQLLVSSGGANILGYANIVGNLNSGNASLGNLATANFFSGNGNLLTSLTGANVSGAVAYATTANAVAGANVSGAVAYATTANAVAGANVSGAVAYATTANSVAGANVTGDVSGANHANVADSANAVAGANVSGAVAYATTANSVAGANVSGQVANALVAGTIYTNAQPNITSVGTLTSLDVSGTITAANITANTGVFTGNGNGLSSLVGANVTGTVANATYALSSGTAGTVTTNAQPNITSVGTLSSLAVTGNASAGNINAGNLLTANYSTSVLTTAAQPNITSVGTLTSLAVTGNITNGNITGGNLVSASYVAGTLTTAAQPNITSVGTLTSLGVNGTVTAVAFTANTGVFTGNGNGLSSIVGANVTGTVSSATTAGTVTTAAQGNITSVGTLTSLSVTGNVSAGNINAGNLLTANYSTAVITTAAQPNITSVGTLSNLVVSGNATANGNVITDSILGRTGAVTITSGGTNTNINLKPNGTGNVDANSTYITNVKDPFSNQDAATKAYVDQQVTTGITYHQPVNAATTTTLAVATGGTTAYNSPNGASNGIGAYISTTGTFTLIDAVNIASAGTRILVKDEANATWNGIYNYTNATAITRSSDADEYGPDSTTQISINDYFFTLTGSINEGTAFIVSAPSGTIVFGTSNITFSVFSTAQVYDAGTGLTLANTTFSISNTAVTAAAYGNGDRVATFTVNGQGQLTAASNVVMAPNAANLTGTVLNSAIVTSGLTTVGTLGSLAVTGNITGGNANVTGQLISTVAIGTAPLVVTSTTTVANLAAATATTAGTVTTAAQGNITSVGTLTSLGVSGTITAPNFTANTGVFTGNGNGLSSLVGANVTGTVGSATNAAALLQNTSTSTTAYPTFSTSSANGNSSAVINTSISANLGNASITATTFVGALSGAATSATTAGTVTTAAQGNITSVGTLTGLTIGNATANAVFGNGTIVLNSGLITGNGNGLSSLVGANVTGAVSFATTANAVAGANVSGTVASATSATNAAALLQNTSTSTTVYPTFSTSSANGNSSAVINTSISANLGNASITATTFVGALSGAATSATTAGTVTTAAQGNITSVGTLTSLGVNGTVTAVAFTANTGVFTGNANGLSSLQGTNVTGTLNSTTLGNSTVYIGTTGIALNRASASQSLTGITSIDGYAATVSGAAQGNITSVGTLTSLAVTGNVTMANVVASTYDITGVATGISAAGTVQANATVLAKSINVVSTVASGAGVVLPVAVAGMRITVMNTSANSLAVYPAASGIINSQVANVAYTQPAGARLDFVSISTTQWYTLNATYG